ncbi:hypothetical protein [Dendronalium sp. ChiSLP03b]|nr:hypothetical protein [Dendronalium sp. ChiSLP03b]
MSGSPQVEELPLVQRSASPRASGELLKPKDGWVSQHRVSGVEQRREF